VRFVRSRVHTIDPVPTATTCRALCGPIAATGCKPRCSTWWSSPSACKPPLKWWPGRKLGIDLTGQLLQDRHLRPGGPTSRARHLCLRRLPGPKDIPQSVVDASAAAAAAGESCQLRATPRPHSRSGSRTNVVGERPRIGVFVCRCGINIAGVVDVPAVRDYAATLPYVEYATDNIYSCSQDTQDTMAQIIKQKKASTGWWWRPARPRPTSRSFRKP
jgi:heterodisulfide reductase subunit A